MEDIGFTESDYVLENVDNVVFYINKKNIRSQKAIEKINGKKIDGFEYQHFINKNPNTLTYLITRKDRQF